MKKLKYIGFSILGIVAVLAIAFMLFTTEEVYDVKPDPIVFNKDVTNTKQRPFIVDKTEYPFKSNWFERDGVSMHFIDEGEGIPVVLCHGNPDWSFLYRDIVKELSSECRLIAYDLPGFGFSDTPQNFGFTPQEHAEWISALILEHLKLEKFIIVVQDWGGPTGLWVATNSPDRVLGAVISNTWAWKPEGTLKTFSNVMKTSIASRLVLNKNYFVTDLLIDNLSEEKKSDEAIVNAYKFAFPTIESRIGTLEFPRQITKSSEWLSQLETRLPSLENKPIEFIFGQQDFAVGSPEIIKKWQSIYPKANTKLLPNANHFTQEDSPESFVTAIREILNKVKE